MTLRQYVNELWGTKELRDIIIRISNVLHDRPRALGKKQVIIMISRIMSKYQNDISAYLADCGLYDGVLYLRFSTSYSMKSVTLSLQGFGTKVKDKFWDMDTLIIELA